MPLCPYGAHSTPKACTLQACCVPGIVFGAGNKGLPVLPATSVGVAHLLMWHRAQGTRPRLSPGHHSVLPGALVMECYNWP